MLPHRMSNWDIKPIYLGEMRLLAQPSVNLTQEPNRAGEVWIDFSAIEIPTRLYLYGFDERDAVPRICCSVDLERAIKGARHSKIPTFSPRIPLSCAPDEDKNVAKKLTLRKLTEQPLHLSK
ncbi:hypothetical protein SPFM1_00028 [Salmonella phage SPFM1]|nr:hypothetical protein SPFM1_00028 [Salmonella phage SPFM1]